MMFFLLAALTQQVPAERPATAQQEAACLAQVARNAAAAERTARGWGVSAGAPARRCLGLALAAQDRYADAAAAFVEAARAAELARDPQAAEDWARAGNAWLAAGDAAKARTALDAALAAGTLDELQRGEAHLDRARALVAADRLAAARTDLDQAIVAAAEDPLAWLLSATLARRMGDAARARLDIAQALRRAPDDAAVQLEAGNIAAQAGEAEKAQAAWREAARLAPDRPAGRSASAALTQFAATETIK